MSCTFVNTHSRRKGPASLQPVGLQQHFVRPLNLVAEPSQVDSWFDYFLDVSASLSVHFSSLAGIVDIELQGRVQLDFGLVLPQGRVQLLYFLLDGLYSFRELLRHRNRGGFGLFKDR